MRSAAIYGAAATPQASPRVASVPTRLAPRHEGNVLGFRRKLRVRNHDLIEGFRKGPRPIGVQLRGISARGLMCSRVSRAVAWIFVPTRLCAGPSLPPTCETDWQIGREVRRAEGFL